MNPTIDSTALLTGLVVLPAQVGSRPWLEGLLFAVLVGVALFAICRSSNRN